jgi:hypothetical protein
MIVVLDQMDLVTCLTEIPEWVRKSGFRSRFNSLAFKPLVVEKKTPLKN